jgi:hypothetical protein
MIDVSVYPPRLAAPGKRVPPEILARGEKPLPERSTTQRLPAADRYDVYVSRLGESCRQRRGVPCDASTCLALVLAVERNLQQYDLGMSKTKLSE